jgi:4'-phosphopantetheinyl transferase
MMGAVLAPEVPPVTAVPSATLLVHLAPTHLPVPDGALLPAEQARVALAAPPDRAAVAAVLLLARTAAAEACGLPVDAVRVDRRCLRCGATTHGVPRVRRADCGPVPHLSLSRCADLVAVAVTGAGPVGLDLERADADPGGATARVALAPGDTGGPLRTWVRKEAVLKAAGTGLAVDPRAFRVVDAADGGRPEVVGDAPAPPAGTGWWLTDLDLGAAHLGAVALAVAPGVDPVVTVRVSP